MAGTRVYTHVYIMRLCGHRRRRMPKGVFVLRVTAKGVLCERGAGIDQSGNPRPRASSVVSDEFRRFGIRPRTLCPVSVVVTRDPKIVPRIYSRIIYYYIITSETRRMYTGG